MSRLLLPLGLAVMLAVDFAPARADIPPGPSPRKPDPPFVPQPPQPAPIDPVTGPPYPPPVPRDPPRRTGPFRSCGSGMGLGLAGIAAAWGVLWLGNRFAGRVSRGTKGDRTG